MGNRTALIIIDPQVDFVEYGKLAVTGGQAAMNRVANFITHNCNKLSHISITLDSHHQHHIAHPIIFIDNNTNKHPNIYTSIKKDDIIGNNPTIRASNPAWQQEIEDYILGLEQRNNVRKGFNIPEINHTIWPPHCLIGTDGMSVVPSVMEAITNWEQSTNKVAGKTTKGSFIFAEHFSVFKAEVADDREPMTKVNWPLINMLANYDTLIWSGLAEDYCLANSFYDFLIELGGNDDATMKEIGKKMIFATDGTAAVGLDKSLSSSFHSFLNKYNVKSTTLSNIF